MKTKNKLILILLVIIILGITYFTFKKFNLGTLTINNQTIKLEIAKSQKEITKGLSGRKELKKDKGMLFIFPDYQIRNFWMKDMLFLIDIIWILDNKIIGIEKNVPLSTDVPLPIYQSPQAINYVLEVTAGFSDKNNIKINDPVIFNLVICASSLKTGIIKL